MHLLELLDLTWDRSEFAVPTAAVQYDGFSDLQFQLEQLLLKARDERRTVNFSEWASIVPSRVTDESGGVDDLTRDIGCIDINSWDANGKRYLEKWTNLVGQVHLSMRGLQQFLNCILTTFGVLPNKFVNYCLYIRSQDGSYAPPYFFCP